MKVAVVGASGLVGAAVVHCLRQRSIDFIALVGLTGNSWHLLRQGITPRVMNVLDAEQVDDCFGDCTHIVNCLRGDDEVMLKGLHNLLHTARKRNIRRFVHLSSVAVYGSFPAPEAADEAARTAPEAGSYGWTKLQQDRMVEAAARRGLPSVILCPPNIGGPASYFLLQVLDGLIRDEFLLLEEEDSVCCIVDVHNLAHACWLALNSEVSDGRRYFVTDDERVTWRQIIARVSGAAELDARPRTCSRAELSRLASPAVSKGTSMWRSVKHLVSSDVRQALRKDPLIAKLDGGLRRLVAKLGVSVEDRLRLAIEGPIRVAAEPVKQPANVRLSAQQLRGVLHSCARIKVELDYRPVYTFAESMNAFERWLRVSRGMADADWQIRRCLFGYR